MEKETITATLKASLGALDYELIEFQSQIELFEKNKVNEEYFKFIILASEMAQRALDEPERPRVNKKSGYPYDLISDFEDMELIDDEVNCKWFNIAQKRRAGIIQFEELFKEPEEVNTKEELNNLEELL